MLPPFSRMRYNRIHETTLPRTSTSGWTPSFTSLTDPIRPIRLIRSIRSIRLIRLIRLFFSRKAEEEACFVSLKQTRLASTLQINYPSKSTLVS